MRWARTCPFEQKSQWFSTSWHADEHWPWLSLTSHADLLHTGFSPEISNTVSKISLLEFEIRGHGLGLRSRLRAGSRLWREGTQGFLTRWAERWTQRCWRFSEQPGLCSVWSSGTLLQVLIQDMTLDTRPPPPLHIYIYKHTHTHIYIHSGLQNLHTTVCIEREVLFVFVCLTLGKWRVPLHVNFFE